MGHVQHDPAEWLALAASGLSGPGRLGRRGPLARTMRPLAALPAPVSRSPSPSRSRCSRAEDRRRRRRSSGEARRGRRHAAAPSARGGGRARTGRSQPRRERSHSLAVRAPAAVSYLRTLAAAQRTLAARLAVAIPAGPRPLALRRRARRRLRRPPRLGARAPARAPGRDRLADASRITRCATPALGARRPRADPGPTLIGATALWGSNLATAGQGIKIGLVDDGIDQAHPLLRPVRLLLSRRLPEGEHRLHHAEGHRRARVPVAVDALEVRGPAVRPHLLLPRDARRRHRGGRLRHADRRPTAARPSRASRRRRISATTRR